MSSEINRVMDLLKDPEVEAMAVITLYMKSVSDKERLRFINWIDDKFNPKPAFKSIQYGVRDRVDGDQIR